MLQNEVPTHDWLVLDDTPSIRQPSIDVSVSLTPENERIQFLAKNNWFCKIFAYSPKK
ncbi:hypothetical protein [Spiroplasma endosymbiont of Ammophila pubescens]|uniref:hypothetical protein n=1 Tax=Spiroplasma endosymbiont of Ammophila pubescens TaxID=3066315 RepID=UPI0032B2495B